MSTPGPATLPLDLSRSTDTVLTFSLFALLNMEPEVRTPLQLVGMRLRAQLFDLDLGQPYYTLPLAIDLQNGVVTMPVSAAAVNEFVGSQILGGTAANVGPPPGYSGGTAAFTGTGAAVLSGGKADLASGADRTAWDLLMVEPRGRRRVLLRGMVSFTD